MNVQIRIIREKYRTKRKESSFCIFDIEVLLKSLAEEGTIWTLNGMKDLCEAEEILIDHYLHQYQEKQEYDLFPF